MSSPNLTLHDFMQSVPVCEQRASLEAVLTIFQSGQHEAIVVVNEQREPLGVIDCPRLMPYLLKQLLVGFTPASANVSLESSSSSVASLDICSLMEPIFQLPAQMRVDEFMPYLPADEGKDKCDRLYALVDAGGRFLGLLSSWKLLKSLLSSTPQYPQSPVTCRQFALTPLLSLLDQFPLPMMLQTEAGSRLHQNLSWREQIGESLPTDKLHATPLSIGHINFPSFEQYSLAGENLEEEASEIQPEHRQNSHSLAVQLSHLQLQGLSPDLLNRPELFVNQDFVVPFRQTNLPVGVDLSLPPIERIWEFIKIPFPSSPLSSDLPPSLWLVLATDVTEQRKLCQKLSAQNIDLVRLNRLKDEFLACISHELKSPLTAIVGLSSLLKEQKLGKLNQRQAHYAGLIYRSGRQLMALVNDLLDLTRLETGQLTLNPISVTIATVCQQAYTAIQEKQKDAIDRQVSFTLDIESGLTKLVADELRLHQMLVHLLDNAVKFTQAGGKIGLRVNCWENWIAFTVWDTGIGIPEESQHLIFRKFQQLQSPLTRQVEGTGLGLVLTHLLARAHGGDVSFISKVGQGSQFTLLLPSNITAEELEREPIIPQISQNPLILIVEVTPQAVENLTEQLKSLNYRVVIARTGTEALEKAKQLKPSTIFLNPTLPLLSGWDVLTLLKADASTQKIPVIMTSVQAEDRQRARANGANGFLCLPISKEALQKLLDSPHEQEFTSINHLTILHLHPELGKMGWDGSMLNPQDVLNLGTQLSRLNHHILEADDLEQAEMIAQVWAIDAIILDSRVLPDPLIYLRSLSQYESLAAIPLVTLDAKTTKAANQITGLSVFPCLVPPHENNCNKLLQVIQIAAGLQRQEGSEGY